MVIPDDESESIVPTGTPLPTLVPTPKPNKEYLYGGDVGKIWKDETRSMGLVKVYRTEEIDGNRPYSETNGGYRAGYTQFLVLELQFDRYIEGYDDYDFKSFWLWALGDDGKVDYLGKYPPHDMKQVRVYYQETIKESLAYEISPKHRNFILCYKFGIGIGNSGKMAYECGSMGYQLKFGD